MAEAGALEVKIPGLLFMTDFSSKKRSLSGFRHLFCQGAERAASQQKRLLDLFYDENILFFFFFQGKTKFGEGSGRRPILSLIPYKPYRWRWKKKKALLILEKREKSVHSIHKILFEETGLFFFFFSFSAASSFNCPCFFNKKKI